MSIRLAAGCAMVVLLSAACRPAADPAPPSTTGTPPSSDATVAPTGDTGEPSTAPTPTGVTVLPTGPTGSPGTGHTGPVQGTGLAETGVSRQPTAGDTGRGATGRYDTGSPVSTVATGDTHDTGPAEATADTAPAVETGAALPTGSGTADTAAAMPTGPTGSTADTALCQVEVPPVPTAYGTELPPITDTGSPCPVDTAGTGDTGASPEGCPEVDWVLYTDHGADQFVNYLHALPDGGVFVIGHDLTGGWALAEGRPDEVVLPLHCTYDYLPWMGVIEADGTVRWARRLADTCGTVFAKGSSVSATGDVLVWGYYLKGSYGPTHVTVDPDGSNPVQLPSDCGACDAASAWWAQLSPDGTVVQAHSMTSEGVQVAYPDDMVLTADGYAIARGLAGERITLNTESGQPVEIVPPADSMQTPHYLAAWDPDGEVAWASVYAHSDYVNPTPERLVDRADGTLLVYASTIVAPGYPKGWGVCTEHETWYTESTGYLTMGHAPYDVASGTLLEPPQSAHSVAWSTVIDTPQGSLGLGYNASDTVIHGRHYEGGLPHLAYVDEFGVPLPGQVVSASLDNRETVGSQLVAAGDDFVVVAGRVEDDVGGTFAWTCGPDVPAHDAPMAHSGRPFMYQAFTPDLHPTCGGIFGIDSGAGVIHNGMAADGEGGVMVGFALVEEATFMEGTPDEVTVVPDDSEVMLLRLHTP